MWADIHCHLNLFDDAKGVVERAKAGNVSVILAVSETLEDSIKSVELAEGNEAVYAGVGLHPSRVSPETALQASKILELFAERKTAKLACVGEVGLDYKYAVTDTQKSLQQGVFEEFLAFAQEKKLASDAEATALELRRSLEADSRTKQNLQDRVVVRP